MPKLMMQPFGGIQWDFSNGVINMWDIWSGSKAIGGVKTAIVKNAQFPLSFTSTYSISGVLSDTTGSGFFLAQSLTLSSADYVIKSVVETTLTVKELRVMIVGF